MSFDLQALLEVAKSRNATLATAESCTGGMIAAALTELAGSSVVFDRGFVTYSNAAKMEMLGVEADTLATHGAVSEEVAHQMAKGALLRSAADLAVSVTGIAGPGGSETKPEGRVCFGLAQSAEPGNMKITTQLIDFGALGRQQVRQATRDHALTLLFEALHDQT